MSVDLIRKEFLRLDTRGTRVVEMRKMSQKLVFELLRDLGGRATTSEVSKLARQRYPEATLYQYVGQQLHKLMKWGTIEYDPASREWYVSSKNLLDRVQS